MGRDLKNTAEAAGYLNVSIHTLEAWRLKDFGPPFFRVGGQCMYDMKELETWLDVNRVTPGEETSNGYR